MSRPVPQDAARAGRSRRQPRSRDGFGVVRTLDVGGRSARVFLLSAFEQATGVSLAGMPWSRRVLLENLLRHEDGESVTATDILRLARGDRTGVEGLDIAFHPARVLMPDSSGLPLLADLASMRDRMALLTGRPELVDPLIPVDIVVDHSVVTDFAGRPDALSLNRALEHRRNAERFRFLRWAQQAFDGVRVVPPGNGILHQLNLEVLAQVVRLDGGEGVPFACPDSLVGTDSHTPMVNALGVMGWGVGGIEAGSAMLGEPISMLVPEVVGCRLVGTPRAGTTATDVVLSLTAALREHGVVGKFVEFFGPGLDAMPLADRATIANMAPEYGATMGFFPIDSNTIEYLRRTGRSAAHVAFVEAYARLQGLWRTDVDPHHDERIDFDLGRVGATLAGPSRPEQRVELGAVASGFRATFGCDRAVPATEGGPRAPADGDVVIAAITSCTNTSNPAVMLAAGLLARNAVRAGLRTRPWVKASLAPGSRRVTDYHREAGLSDALDALGFQVVGYGCMTCMGGAGELVPGVAEAIAERGLAVAAVLSGNRNFEARIHPAVRANYLASPPLVVAYALAGSLQVDLESEPLGAGADGRPVFLRDVWPSDEEVRDLVQRVVQPALFTEGYRRLFEGDETWEALGGGGRATFDWDPRSTYMRRAPYADAMGTRIAGEITVRGARILALLGDGVTTDHISPVGSTSPDSAVGRYLLERGVAPPDFNLLVTRRANPDIVARTAFANVRLRNGLVPGIEGGVTRFLPDGTVTDIHDAAMRYRELGVPLVVVAGAGYGSGSSRDTAAKGTALLGVRAVIAEGFERIHRSNLVGMGVLPLQFPPGTTRATLGLDGHERVDLWIEAAAPRPRMPVHCRFTRADGSTTDLALVLRVDTPRELRWIAAGGILPFVGNELLRMAAASGAD